jgi:acid stress-induced BolA-like protein IbaG/YrbA
MTLRILSSPPPEPAEVARRIEAAVAEALPGAEVRVRPASPGHYELEVVSAAFAGKRPVQQQQLVYRAIAPLMSGDDAPVHAIDRMVTRTP